MGYYYKCTFLNISKLFDFQVVKIIPIEAVASFHKIRNRKRRPIQFLDHFLKVNDNTKPFLIKFLHLKIKFNANV